LCENCGVELRDEGARTMSAFVKEVSASERYFVALDELRPPFVIHLLLEGRGEPSGDELFDALSRTTEANPGSSLRLDQSGESLRWTLGAEPTLTIVDAPEFTGRSGAKAPFLLWHLSSSQGPTTELVFVRGKEHNYLVFRALHSVMDGQGTLLWVKDFMRCLRGEAPLGNRSTLTLDELLGEVEARRPAPLADALSPCGPPSLETRGEFHWRRMTVKAPLDAATSGRVAIAIAERARAHAEGTVRVNLPTDLRRFRPEERTTGNLFGALFLEVPPWASAESISMKIMQGLYRNEGAKPLGRFTTQASASLAANRVKVLWDLAHLHDTGRYIFSATLSHLGALKSTELSAPVFAASGAFFVPVVADSGCVISLNGFDEATEACVGLSDRFAGDGRLDELAAAIKAAVAGP
jgi:hypothetical protein